MKHHSTTQHPRFFSLKTLLVFSLFSFIFSSVNATVHTVSNRSWMDADFTQVTDAIAAASAGDTIYIHGSQTPYADFTLDKRLHIMGPGYFLEDQPNQNGIYETEYHSALVNYINIVAGAEHSIIEGMYITTRIDMGCDDITVRKNCIQNGSTSQFAWSITFTADVDSCFIYNNFLNKTWQHGYAIVALNPHEITNLFIVNNIIYGSIAVDDQVNIGTQLFFNNTVIGSNEVRGVTAMFNIFANFDVTTSATVPAIFKENIFADATPPIQAPASDGNVAGVDMHLVFEDFQNAAVGLEKEYFHLEPAPNPATTNCLDLGGTGCGASLGPNPHYLLGGIPEMPILYHLTSDGGPDANGDINVTVKAKSY